MAIDTLRCVNCGFENVPRAKFCANCGKPLGQAAPETVPVLPAESRKVITALFVDLVGSTGLTERLDPEEARAVVGRFYSAVQQVVERFGGAVANLLGDGVLAVFGLPVSHENDPERAVRAGLALRDTMPALNQELDARHGVRLDIRIGINTGEVVAASGSTFDRDFLISDAVTTAARLQQTVAPGSVVVGGRTYSNTRDVIEYRELPPMAVRGKTAPQQVWEALAVRPERLQTHRAVAPLVGRQSELALLRYLYQRTCSEALVHLATILGQPGVGKSRLLREFLAASREAVPEPLVLRGRSIAFGGQIGYHALLDILRGQAGLMDTDAPDVVRSKLVRWLREAVQGHEHLLDGLLLTFGIADGAESSPEQMRRELFDAWRGLLTGLASRRPVIAAFEDMLWADEGVLDLIQSMASGVEGASLFLICVGRSELLERRPDWGAGVRNAITIDLKPLRPEETAELVDWLGRAELTPEMRRKIAERAEGNPLFAEELVGMLTEGASRPAPARDVTIPDTVQAVITARIDRLPADERRALQMASVIGRTFWPSVVGLLAGLSNGDVAQPLAGLRDKGLISERAQSTIAGEPEYVFRHILTRDVAYGMLPRSHRQRAHVLTARWLEERLGDRVEEAVEILAEHLRMAGDDVKAALYLHRAANKARRLYANADAIRLFDQALEAARKAASSDQLPSLHLDRGEVHQFMGTYAAALADFEAGLAAAREIGDRRLEAVLENRVGFVHHREARHDDAEDHFRRAAALARAIGDHQALGQTLVDLATVAWDRGNMPVVDQILTEGITLLKEAGDRSTLSRALNLRCMAHLAMGDFDLGIAAAEEGLAIAREAGDRSKEATSLSYLGVLHAWRSDLRLATDRLQAALEVAEAIGDRRRIIYAKEFLDMVHFFAGEWGEVVRLMEEVLPEARNLTPLELPFLYVFLGDTYYELGDMDHAHQTYQVAAAFETRSLGWQRVTAQARLMLARIDRDRDAIDRAIDEALSLPLGAFVPTDVQALLPTAEAMLEVDRIADLRTLVETIGPIVERLPATSFRAALRIIQARLAALDGNLAAAGALLDEAVRLADASENAVVIRKARELRLQLFNRDEDQEALRRLYDRIAAGLPDDLRTIFLNSPRVAPIMERGAARA